MIIPYQYNKMAALWQKNMKPEKASLHAPKVRFMARSAASYADRRAS